MMAPIDEKEFLEDTPDGKAAASEQRLAATDPWPIHGEVTEAPSGSATGPYTQVHRNIIRHQISAEIGIFHSISLEWPEYN
jgi:hypothetical protein